MTDKEARQGILADGIDPGLAWDGRIALNVDP
jgi:hypothetical protein